MKIKEEALFTINVNKNLSHELARVVCVSLRTHDIEAVFSE